MKETVYFKKYFQKSKKNVSIVCSARPVQKYSSEIPKDTECFVFITAI